MEDCVARRHHVRARRSVDADRRERAVVTEPDAPGVQQQPGKIASVIDMQVGEEYRFQPGEVESRLDKP